ncbi:MAG: magnesium transporter [Lautropia sp.]|nr:MAG: magnesium transporter [Pseudomonadota bacterium]MBC6960173.1 magnesium transporter [Lautropia sp.]MCL4702271.1 magnesium transporter [Burkholderiaceae bacterium]MDL1906421.1 magnesium transporter [Betaproteobacteria bacterium PRO1]RIK90157.1 MAG: magnesium transporter [Burkholderiales bacterium]
MADQDADFRAEQAEERPDEALAIAQPRDPEQASRALAAVQELLRRHDLALDVAARQRPAEAGEHAEVPEAPQERQLLDDLRARLDELHPADVAFVLEALPFEQRMIVWDLVKAERDGEILLEVSESVRESLIRSMDREELVDAVETLDADEIAELAPDLPTDVVEEVRRGLSQEEREQLRASMSFPEGSVGELMDFEAITVQRGYTLDMVLRELRGLEELPDHTDQVYVVDERGELVGALPLDRLLINQPEVLVEDVMRRDLLTLQPLEDASEAAHAFERYDLVSAPVVDPRNRVIGRVTVAEVLDLIREEGESEVLAKAGLREEEDLFAGVWASAKNRWLWLALNLCTAFFASRVISAFDGTIERVVALATLMPIVAGIAGNSGNQTMTLIIRSLALGQVTTANARRLLLKELAIAALNGLVWGGVAGLVAWLLYRDTPYGVLLGLTMTMAMVLNLLVGALIALAVPMVLERFGRDPAIGSSVLLTFSTDSMGFLIFLGLATLLFR